MNSAPLRRERGFHQRLGQRRVRVDREVELLERQSVLDRERGLGYEVRRARSDDVRPEDLARARIGDDLGKALALPQRERTTRCRKREATDPDLEALVLCLFLADTLNAIFDMVYVYDALVINFSAALLFLIF